MHIKNIENIFMTLKFEEHLHIDHHAIKHFKVFNTKIYLTTTFIQNNKDHKLAYFSIFTPNP
jgi:hypothetical protein